MGKIIAEENHKWMCLFLSSAVIIGTVNFSYFYEAGTDYTSAPLFSPKQPGETNKDATFETDSLAASVFQDSAECDFNEDRRDFAIEAARVNLKPDYNPDPFPDDIDSLRQYREVVSELLLTKIGNARWDLQANEERYYDWDEKALKAAGELDDRVAFKKCADGGEFCHCSAKVDGLGPGASEIRITDKFADGQGKRTLTYLEAIQYAYTRLTAAAGSFDVDGAIKGTSKGAKCEAAIFDNEDIQCFCGNIKSYVPFHSALHETLLGKKPRGSYKQIPLIQVPLSKEQAAEATAPAGGQAPTAKRAFKVSLLELGIPDGGPTNDDEDAVRDSVQVYYDMYLMRYETSLKKSQGIKNYLTFAFSLAIVLFLWHGLIVAEKLKKGDDFLADQGLFAKVAHAAGILLVPIGVIIAIFTLATSVSVSEGRWDGDYEGREVFIIIFTTTFLLTLGGLHYHLRNALYKRSQSDSIYVLGAWVVPMLTMVAQIIIFIYLIAEESLQSSDAPHCDSQKSVNTVMIVAIVGYIVAMFANNIVFLVRASETTKVPDDSRHNWQKALSAVEYVSLALFFCLALGSVISYPTCSSIAGSTNDPDLIWGLPTIFTLIVVPLIFLAVEENEKGGNGASSLFGINYR